jgi:predicted metal-dependent phosphoesterase TrpH
MIDLHIHSSASDGTLTPIEVLDRAKALALEAFALTDHDTIAGSRQLLQVGIPATIGFISGVEISAVPPPSFSCAGSFHILGYLFDIDDPLLNKTLQTLQQARKNRNPSILQKLKALGIDISLEEVMSMAGDGQMGRPHIARAMVEKGFAASIDDAFNRFIGTGQPAYVDKYRIECAKAIAMIRAAGGVPILAHPCHLRLQGGKTLEALVEAMIAMGLAGIEVFYPDQSPAQTAAYMETARRHGLLMTGGTDFHGELKPDIQMGSGRGNLDIPFSIYETLVRR